MQSSPLWDIENEPTKERVRVQILRLLLLLLAVNDSPSIPTDASNLIVRPIRKRFRRRR
jgi:hypothetical protein